MWYGLSLSPKDDPDFASSVSELLQSTARNLVLSAGIVYLVWHLGATVAEPTELGSNVWLLTPLVALTSVLSLHFLSKHFLVAQAIWQIGVAAVITLALYLFQQPEIAFLYSLLPLVATVTVGWPAGLLSEGLVLGLVLWLFRYPSMPPLPAAYRLGIVGSGVFTGVLGWAATLNLLTVTRWALFYFEQAQEKVEGTRDQQLELKQIQEDLVKANRELARLSDRLRVMHAVAEEARRAKEEFVANVSHELRTPLNMIIGFSEMITQAPQVYSTKLPAALLADITAIQRNSQHLLKLVNDVLDLSQVEAGRMALSKEWASLKQIIDEATEAIRALYRSKGLYLEVEVPPHLPPLFCDSTRIRQVVFNLLSNAGRFTEEGGVRVTVGCETDHVVVSIADTGPGIAIEDQKKLFEPFQQLDGSPSRRHGGSGLGLSISKRLVEMHQGKMWLDSAVGKGTTIYFSLPLETPSPTAPCGVGGDAVRWFSPYSQYDYKGRTRRSKAPVASVPPRFVFLEKGEVLQRLFRRYLYDVETVPVRDIDRAIRLLSQSPAQALIINVPPFEETAAIMNQLTRLPYQTPVVTCWVPGEDEAARRLGVVRYLVKPVTREVLLSTLEDLGESVRSVLVVDDEPEVLRLFTRMLSSAKHAYDVLQAKNGQRALTLLRQRRPDVMLLDLIMPGLDGFRVLQEKGQDPSIREIPVVVISSRDPSGEPIMSEAVTITRGGGLSVRDLLACIQAVSAILARPGQPSDQGPPEKPPA